MRAHRSSLILLAIAAALASSFTGCASDSTDDPVPSRSRGSQSADPNASPGDTTGGGSPGTTTKANGEAQLADVTEVVGKALADEAVVEADRLIFKASAAQALLSKKAGDILIGDRQAKGAGGKNPDGFLRKVKSASQQGDQVVVLTEGATLPEAVKKLTFNIKTQTPQLTAAGPVLQTEAFAPGFHTLGSGDPIKLIDFSGKSLLDYNGSVEVDTNPSKSIGFNAFAKMTKGTVSFTPSWDVGADVGFLEIKSFHATATGQLDAEVELNVGVKLTTDLDAESFTKLLAKKIFNKPDATLADYPIDLGSFTVGPLPIPVKANFKAVLACDFVWGGGAEVTVGGKASAKITAGIKYENEQLSPVFDKSAELSQTGPMWVLDGVTRVKCAIEPRFDLRIYDLAMAEVWANGYVDLQGSLACGAPPAGGGATGKLSGKALAGARAGVHAKVDLMGLYKLEKQCTLFDVQSTPATFEETFTLPGGANATCTPTPAGGEEYPPPSPDSCFGSGSGAGGAPSLPGGNGGAGGACVPSDGGVLSPTPPDTWTCDKLKYGDCKCDCDCGDKDIDCEDGACSKCTHDECTAGEALGSMCTSCTEKVCAKDPYCCEQYWGPSCFAAVESECGMKCNP